jgi:hypothetical protein
MRSAPHRSEAAEFYFTYIDKVPPGDVRRLLADQAGEVLTLLRGIPDDRSLYRYAPEKWSIREVVSHINDAERVFSFRALWFARGLEAPLRDVAAERSSAGTTMPLPRSRSLTAATSPRRDPVSHSCALRRAGSARR